MTEGTVWEWSDVEREWECLAVESPWTWLLVEIPRQRNMIRVTWKPLWARSTVHKATKVQVVHCNMH